MISFSPLFPFSSFAEVMMKFSPSSRETVVEKSPIISAFSSLSLINTDAFAYVFPLTLIVYDATCALSSGSRICKKNSDGAVLPFRETAGCASLDMPVLGALFE